MSTTTEALIQQAKRNRRLMPLWLDFMAQSKREPEIAAALSAFHARVRATIARLLTPFLSARFKTTQIDALAAAVLGGFMGLMAQELTDPDGMRFDTHVSRFMAAFKGLTSGEPS